MTEAEYAKMIVERLKIWVKVYPRISAVYVDSAAKLFRTALREEMRRQGLNFTIVKSFNKADGINARIELTCMLLMQGRYKVADHMSPWHEALQMATWDEKAYEKGEWWRLDNGSYPVDTLDAAEYSYYPYAKYLETINRGL